MSHRVRTGTLQPVLMDDHRHCLWLFVVDVSLGMFMHLLASTFEVEMINAASSLLSLLQTGYFLVREWQDARGDRGITGIDHAGHLTGFATGALWGGGAACGGRIGSSTRVYPRSIERCIVDCGMPATQLQELPYSAPSVGGARFFSNDFVGGWEGSLIFFVWGLGSVMVASTLWCPERASDPHWFQQ